VFLNDICEMTSKHLKLHVERDLHWEPKLLEEVV